MKFSKLLDEYQLPEWRGPSPQAAPMPPRLLPRLQAARSCVFPSVELQDIACRLIVKENGSRFSRSRRRTGASGRGSGSRHSNGNSNRNSKKSKIVRVKVRVIEIS